MDKQERQEIRFRRIERSMKYCVECGRRLKEGSYDRIHKSCERKFENDDNEPKYNNDTGTHLFNDHILRNA